MSRTSGKEDHKKAWDVWLDTRNFVKVSDITGFSYAAVLKWAKSDYQCRDGCQYHDYDRLKEEVSTLHHVRNKMIAQGEYNPVDHYDAALAEVNGKRDAPLSSFHEQPSYEMFRSDKERLSYWELLEERIIYQSTLVPMRPLESMTREEYHNFMQDKGLRVNNLKDAIHCLNIINENIQRIQNKGKEKETALDQEVVGSMSELKLLRKALKDNPQIVIDVGLLEKQKS